MMVFATREFYLEKVLFPLLLHIPQEKHSVQLAYAIVVVPPPLDLLAELLLLEGGVLLSKHWAVLLIPLIVIERQLLHYFYQSGSNVILETHMLSQIELLLRSLNNMWYKFLKALMVNFDGKLPAQQVMALLKHWLSNGIQIPQICWSHSESWS